MSNTPIEFTYRAKLDQFAADLAKATGIQETEAKKLVNAVDKDVRKLERSAKRAAGSTEKEWKDKFAGIKQGSSAVFGGVVNDIDDVVAGLGAVGPAAAAFALVTAGALATGAAVIGLVRNADELIEALAPLNDQEGFGFDAASIAAVAEANANMDALGLTTKAVAATLGAEFGPSVAQATEDLLRLALAGLDGVQAFTKAHDVIHEFGVFLVDTLVQMIGAPITGLASLVEGLGMVGEALGFDNNMLKQAGDAYDEFTRGIAESIVGTADLGGGLHELAETYGVSEERAESLSDATGRLTDKFKEQRANAAKLADLLDKVNDRNLDGGEKIIEQYDELIAQAQKLGASESSIDMLRQAAHVDLMKWLDEEAVKKEETAAKGEKANQERAEREAAARTRAMEQNAAAQQKLDDAALAAIKREVDARKQAFADVASGFSALTDLAGTFASRELDAQIDTIDSLREARKEARENGDAEEVKSLNKRIAAAKQAALKAWRQQQIAALSTIAIQTAVSVVEASPNPFAIGAALAIGAAAATAVATEPAPKLYAGSTGTLDPDAVMVEGHRGEMVANDRLVRNDGDAIAEGNATGRLPGSGRTEAVLALDGRTLSSLFGWAAAQGGAFRDVLDEGRDMPGSLRRAY